MTTCFVFAVYCQASSTRTDKSAGHRVGALRVFDEGRTDTGMSCEHREGANSTLAGSGEDAS